MSDHPSSQQAAANRLAGQSSPYLLLHRHNPVDWYPWGEEALEPAPREDKPIFPSAGYSPSSGCPARAREAFPDPRGAGVMTRDFVTVRLARAERPAPGAVSMPAPQIVPGPGGWPTSAFPTPRLGPFFAGTCCPPEDSHGR